ncbi:YbjN domain-containing protein [Paracoccus sp. S-4012]|uniref:YbjN domain-containing protein n=1 Tax=Paracoccus sp. S-4012 TaxID=2665648 RepID=UPI0012AFCC26|nr:YbjN domain-containing protein [Paracoccus sp. S-4012]MRX49681.1 YbjN domain-containing protein [Paracoccus sp. S-4012]
MLVRSALALALMVVPAFSQDLVDGSDPEAILAIAKGYGSADLQTDDAGDPQIIGRMDGQQYAVSFYGCEGGKDCTNLQFAAVWVVDGAVTAEAVDAWNEAKRFGKAYLDEDGDPWLEMDVNLAFGVTRQNLDDTFDWWKVVVDGFIDEVVAQ